MKIKPNIIKLYNEIVHHRINKGMALDICNFLLKHVWYGLYVTKGKENDSGLYAVWLVWSTEGGFLI
jgi:hypothetical protein